MLKNLIGKLGDLGNKEVLLTQYLISGLVVIIALAFAYTATAHKDLVNARDTGSPDPKGTLVKEATEPAILEWMKERSDMPEHVLSNIYSVAMNSANADLILAICLVESNFNPHVESEKGAVGLMGIMPSVWLEELKTKGIVSHQNDLYSISSNINSGVYVLGRYLARTNNLREALSRYAGGDPAYATKVLRMRSEISRTRHSEEQARLTSRSARG